MKINRMTGALGLLIIVLALLPMIKLFNNNFPDLYSSSLYNVLLGILGWILMILIITVLIKKDKNVPDNNPQPQPINTPTADEDTRKYRENIFWITLFVGIFSAIISVVLEMQALPNSGRQVFIPILLVWSALLIWGVARAISNKALPRNETWKNNSDLIFKIILAFVATISFEILGFITISAAIILDGLGKL